MNSILAHEYIAKEQSDDYFLTYLIIWINGF